MHEPVNNSSDSSYSLFSYRTNMKVVLLFVLATTIATSQVFSHQFHLLRPHSGSGGHHVTGLNGLSWRLAVEVDNIRNWEVVPEACENYVGHYMLGHQYRQDCHLAASEACKYANSLKLAGDGKDIWIFDIDETSLSNLPYFARPENAFGAKEYNETAFEEWVAEGKAPALPAILHLYEKLLRLEFKIVFISARNESFRQITEENMKKVGYLTWEKLILKQTSDSNTTSVVYKSQKRTELVEAGYRIMGNMGDQWSDLLGTNVGNRTFKVPDPMYYIS